jgi:hypothetical protein
MPAKLPKIPDIKSLRFRKTLSIPSLLKKVKASFNKVKDHRKKKPDYSLVDVLMSGLAIFGLKCPSLLDFETKRKEKNVNHNLQTLYDVENTPCDSQLRNVLDQVNPEELRQPTIDIIQELQRQGVLEEYRYLGKFLVTLDGTGKFSSNAISCPQCCEKHHRNGEVEYYHQLLVATLVHPDKKTVLPLFNEPIVKEDGKSKNDCELNAAKRLLPALKKAFPRLEIIISADALLVNGPFLELLRNQGFSFIIRFKEGNNKTLMETVQSCLQQEKTDEFETYDKDNERLRGYRFINDLPLNKTHADMTINYLDYWEVDKTEKEKNFAWITDITLSREKVYEVMRAGRSRWKIENETFNTLKNLGYHFEHNYGHGKKYLSTVIGTLMLLAFLLDQVQELCCTVFQAAKNRYHSRALFWDKLRSSFIEHFITSWEILYMAIIHGHKVGILTPEYPDTS